MNIKKKFKIVCFDMDGTLIKGTTANLFFAKLMNVEKEVLDLEYKLKKGEINSDKFMVVVSEIMHQLTVDYVKRNFDSLPIIDGIDETLSFFKRIGIVPVIATTSNVLFAECFKQKYGFEHVFGTIHKISGEGRIGVGTNVCSAKHKIHHIQELLNNHGGSLNEVIAIGDSFSDIPLFSKVGCSIAFNYDKVLEGKADLYIKSNNIYSIINKIGEKYEIN